MSNQETVLNTEGSEAKLNYLKTRSDTEITKFISSEDSKFKIISPSECTWVDKNNEFTEKELRSRIEPWLTSLFQSEHLSLLAGSGLTLAVNDIAGVSAAGMGKAKFKTFANKIDSAALESANRAGRKDGNFEDQLRVANEVLRALEIFNSIHAKDLQGEITAIMKAFAKDILLTEKSLAEAEDREEAFQILVNFLMSFASRLGTRDRLNIFTTNYDRLIEAGAEIAGLHLLDRFVGNLLPFFRSSRLDIDMHYNPPGIRGEPRYLEGVARFSKLHGSVDWLQSNQDIRRIGLPFGAENIENYLKAPGLNEITAHQLMIYPNAAKDRETAFYPYVELFRDFAAAVCRPNSTLVTYGYSFGDEHINRIIEDMLTIPSTHLVIISFDDRLGRVMETYEKLGRPSQITLLVGDHLGNLKTLTENYLPKAAIDKATFRMSELLSKRFGADNDGNKPKDKGNPDGNSSTAGGIV